MSLEKNTFVDIWLFYPSSEDEGMWVAHSINTDQIALGRSKLEALVAMKKVIKALLEEAEEDPRISILSPASREIKDMLKNARQMSPAMFERADELVVRTHKQAAKGLTAPARDEIEQTTVDLELIAK